MTTARRDLGLALLRLLAALCLAAAAAWCLAAGAPWPLAAIVTLCALANLPAVIGVAARHIARERLVARLPDYARIAELERHIFGEAYRHDGAPAIPPAPARGHRPPECVLPPWHGESCTGCRQHYADVCVQEKESPVPRAAVNQLGMDHESFRHATDASDPQELAASYRRAIRDHEARMALTAGIPPARIGEEDMARWTCRARKAGYIGREGLD